MPMTRAFAQNLLTLPKRAAIVETRHEWSICLAESVLGGSKMPAPHPRYAGGVCIWMVEESQFELPGDLEIGA
jgi:hypothetical protein